MAKEPLSANQWKRKSRKQRAGRYDRKLCSVYGLMDGFGKIRYIGQTRSTLARRLELHFKDADKSNSPVNRWLRGSYGVQIFMIDSNATWDVSEILYIDRYRREGHDLLNVLRGGTDTIHAVGRERITMNSNSCP